MQLQYDLSSEPWIPVRMLHDPERGLKGSIQYFGLREVLLRAHEIQEVETGSPLETISINRLLLAIAIHIFPETEEEIDWLTIREAGRFDSKRVDTYFRERSNKFDLLDSKRPFLQHAEPLIDGIAPLSRLFAEALGGIGTPILNHEFYEPSRPIPLDKAARVLITTQATALGGGNNKPFNLSNAPLAGFAAFWVRGRSFFDALLLNAPPSLDARLSINGSGGNPAWDRPLTPTEQQRRRPDSYLDYLTWQSRRIRLVVEENGEKEIVATGVRISQGDKVIDLAEHEPMAAYVGGRNKVYPLSLVKERAVWRDSGVILGTGGPTGEGHAPRTLEWIANNVWSFSSEERRDLELQVDVFGMVNSQAKVEIWRHERMPVYPIYFTDPDRREALDKALKYAEFQARGPLHSACQTFARHLRFPGHDPGKLMGTLEKAEVDEFVRFIGAERRFWSRLEVPFYGVLYELARADDLEASLTKWRKIVWRQVREAYHEATMSLGETARVLQAYAEGEKELFSSPVKSEVAT